MSERIDASELIRQSPLRVAIGRPGELFAPVWRFWTYRDSAYFAVRSMGGYYKASYHPADERHETAAWMHGWTNESNLKFDDTGSRLGHVWKQAPEFMLGWYKGPLIQILRLENYVYDLPSAGKDAEDLPEAHWVDAPSAGTMRTIALFVVQDVPNQPEYVLEEGEQVLAILPMRDGWYLSVHTVARPFQDHEPGVIKETLADARIGISRAPPPGSESASLIWVTTSPQGPPLFVQMILGSENYDVRPELAEQTNEPAG